MDKLARPQGLEERMGSKLLAGAKSSREGVLYICGRYFLLLGLPRTRPYQKNIYHAGYRRAAFHGAISQFPT